MAEVVRYVNTDSSGGDGTTNNTSGATAAFASLSAAEAALDGGSNAGDDLIIECSAPSGTADTTALDIDGMTYDSVTVQAADGDEAVKTGLDTSRYRLSTSDSTATLSVSDDNVTVSGLQIENTGTGKGISNVTSVGCTFENLRIVGNASADDGIYINGAETATPTYVINCIVDTWGDIGIFVAGESLSAYIYHCVVVNCADDGIYTLTDDAVCINTASFSNTDDFVGTFSELDHCASDDGDGTNAVSPSGSDWDNEFNDPANGDFTLLNTGNCYQGGTTGTGVSTDIEGDSYDADNPSIGVDEYVAAGGTTAPIGTLSGPLGGPLAGVF